MQVILTQEEYNDLLQKKNPSIEAEVDRLVQETMQRHLQNLKAILKDGMDVGVGVGAFGRPDKSPVEVIKRMAEYFDTHG